MRSSSISRRSLGFLAALLTLSLFAAVSPAAAQSVYVESQGSAAGGRFGVLNLSNGDYQLLGTRSILLSGLALGGDGTLYGSTTTNQIYTVNPLNGQLTLRANLGLNGGEITSIAFASDGSLYGLLSSNTTGDASLIRVNNLATTPTTTSLGSLGFGSNGAIAGDSGGNLYATEGDFSPSGFGSLFRFGTSGGAATSLSPFYDAGFNAPVYAMSFSASIDTLFAVDKGTDGSGFAIEGGIYQADRTTGIATPTATYDPTVVGNVFAVTNVILVPESGTFALFLPALALLAAPSAARIVIARRRRK